MIPLSPHENKGKDNRVAGYRSRGSQVKRKITKCRRGNSGVGSAIGPLADKMSLKGRSDI